MIRNWILEINLPAFLDMLATIVEYDFTPDEWNAVRFGVRETNDEQGHWYEYEFAGASRAHFKLARSSGSSIITLHLESDAETESRVEVVVLIAQRYQLFDLTPKIMEIG
jgi:hypothetical protein